MSVHLNANNWRFVFHIFITFFYFCIIVITMNLFENSLYPRKILDAHATLENYEKTSPKIDLIKTYLVRNFSFMFMTSQQVK